MKQTETPAASGEAPETSDPQPETKRPRQKGHRGKAPRPVTQIDPQTLQPLQQFPTIREAAETVGCLASNIHRAVSQLRSAGSYYWCDPQNAANFADLMARKNTTPTARRAIAATINKGRRKQVGDAKAEKAKAEKEQQRLAEKNVELMERNDMPQAKADSQERLEVIAKSPKPSTSASPLEQYSDRELADELRRRGWLGDLTKTLNI